MSRLLCLTLLLLAASAVVSAAVIETAINTDDETTKAPETDVSTKAPETTEATKTTEATTTLAPETTEATTTLAPETTEATTTLAPETTEATTTLATKTTEATTTQATETTEATTTATTKADTENPGQDVGTTTVTAPDATTATATTKETPATVEDTVTINFVNDLRYGLYPLSATATGAADATRCTPPTDQACLGGLACLAAKKEDAAAAKKALWLHAGVALGYGDLSRTLKLDDAAKALDLLAFDCLSVDADAFRFGLEHAKTHALARKKSVCCNCQELLAGSDVPAYMLHPVDGAPNCRVAVIGILGKDRASTYVAESLVSDEVESIQKAIDDIKQKDNKGTLYVVIGEASDDLAQSILTQVADVSVVLHSGDDSRNNSYSLVSASKTLRASLAAVTKPDNMQVGSVTLQLDKSTCRPASDPAVEWISYNTATSTCTGTGTGEATVTQAKAIVADLSAKLDQAAATVGRSLRAVGGSMDTCGSVSCALGQLVADGVRTAVNKQATSWDDAVRAVIVPAVVFDDDAVLGADKLTGDAVRGVFADDPFVCVASVSGRDLHALLEAMLAGCCEGAPVASFPQVAGMRVALDRSGSSSRRIAALRLQGEDLALRTVAVDDVEAYRVALPCSYIDNELVRADGELASRLRVGLNATSVALSDALLWRLRAADDVLVPPQVEERVYAFLDFPTQDEICEDLTGVTVCYTFLVTGAIALISYLIYEVWRYRSTLSYVR